MGILLDSGVNRNGYWYVCLWCRVGVRIAASSACDGLLAMTGLGWGYGG